MSLFWLRFETLWWKKHCMFSQQKLRGDIPGTQLWVSWCGQKPQLLQVCLLIRICGQYFQQRYSDVLSVTAGHRPVPIQGEGTDNGVNTQICGSLGTTEVTIYHSILSDPLWFTSPHMQKIVTTLKVPKVSPLYCTRIELKVSHFII